MKKRITKSFIPNLLTLVNLFSGFAAIVYATKEDFTRAAIFILIAAIFDMLDGMVARLIHASSEFGAELDSLCDVVSFGVAPSFMLYQVYFHQFNELGLLVSSLPALAGALRLARFNVQLTSMEDKKYFKGLPIPSGALTIVSYLIFFHIPGLIPEAYNQFTMLFVTLLTSIAMVSTIKFDNIPRPSKKSFKQRPVISIIFLVGLIACIFTAGTAIFPFMMFYIVASTLRQFYFWYHESKRPDDEIDETEEPEPNPFD